MFTDASGIGWAGVLTQEFEDDKGKKKQHPICYVSGQFRERQQNWAALMKEAYITDAEVTIKCNHLPLRKFLQKQTLNAKVNNWAVELEQFNLKLEWIQGTKNTLAPTVFQDYERWIQKLNYNLRKKVMSLVHSALKMSLKPARSRWIFGHH